MLQRDPHKQTLNLSLCCYPIKRKLFLSARLSCLSQAKFSFWFWKAAVTRPIAIRQPLDRLVNVKRVEWDGVDVTGGYHTTSFKHWRFLSGGFKIIQIFKNSLCIRLEQKIILLSNMCYIVIDNMKTILFTIICKVLTDYSVFHNQ